MDQSVSSGVRARPSDATAGASTSAAIASSRRSRRSTSSGTSCSRPRRCCSGPARAACSTGAALRLPARADERVAQSRPVEAVRCVASTSGPRAPAEEPGQSRGLLRSPVRLASLSTLLQDLHREGVGVPVTEFSADLGRPAREGSLARARGCRGAEAEAAPPSRDAAHAVTSLIEEFKYPKYGPGMMWEVATEKVTAGRRDARVRAHGHGHRAQTATAPTRSAPSTRVATNTSIRART